MVAISGDFDFQFLIEELAVGAQFNIPYIYVLVNNAYLGLIRQSQRAFDMDYCLQLAFEQNNFCEVKATVLTTPTLRKAQWVKTFAS